MSIISKYNNYLSNKEKELIIQLYHEGLNTVEISKIINKADTSVSRFLKKYGFNSTANRGKLNKNDKENIKQMYLSGMTSKQIYNIYSKKN